jgi:hypothetical protein
LTGIDIDVRAPAVAHGRRMHAPDGRAVFVTIARLTYSVDVEGKVRLAREPSPIRFCDILDGRLVRHADGTLAPSTTLRFPSDDFDYKPGTDVLLVATAHPPDGAGATLAEVSLRVGSIHRRLRVWGPRVHYDSTLGIVPGPPAQLSPTPLVYELAHGGTDPAHPDEMDLENPIGCSRARDRRMLIGRPAPSIEDPAEPLRPAGVAPIAPSWSPRRERFGTLDETWRRERAPHLPHDFDPRHRSSAPEGQWSEQPLPPDVPIELVGVTPEPRWSFRLPRYGLSFATASSRGERELSTHLDTLLIDADARRVEVTFRSSVTLDRNAPERVIVYGDRSFDHEVEEPA